MDHRLFDADFYHVKGLRNNRVLSNFKSIFKDVEKQPIRTPRICYEIGNIINEPIDAKKVQRGGDVFGTDNGLIIVQRWQKGYEYTGNTYELSFQGSFFLKHSAGEQIKEILLHLEAHNIGFHITRIDICKDIQVPIKNLIKKARVPHYANLNNNTKEFKQVLYSIGNKRLTGLTMYNGTTAFQIYDKALQLEEIKNRGDYYKNYYIFNEELANSEHLTRIEMRFKKDLPLALVLNLDLFVRNPDELISFQKSNNRNVNKFLTSMGE